MVIAVVCRQGVKLVAGGYRDNSEAFKRLSGCTALESIILYQYVVAVAALIPIIEVR